MDKVTITFYSALGAVTVLATLLVTKLDSYIMRYRQSQRDRRIYGRNAIMRRMLEK